MFNYDVHLSAFCDGQYQQADNVALLTRYTRYTISTKSKQRENELRQQLGQLRAHLAQKEAEIEKSNRENEQRLEQMRSRREREVEHKRRMDAELASRLKAAES